MLSKKILIVEDEYAELMAQLLAVGSRSAYRLFIARDGIEALREIALREPDLIITDLRMPRMDGLELVVRIRETSNVPIIAITAFSDAFNHDAVLNAGADVYRLKPVRLRTLLGDIARLLEKASVWCIIVGVNIVMFA